MGCSQLPWIAFQTSASNSPHSRNTLNGSPHLIRSIHASSLLKTSLAATRFTIIKASAPGRAHAWDVTWAGLSPQSQRINLSSPATYSKTAKAQVTSHSKITQCSSEFWQRWQSPWWTLLCLWSVGQQPGIRHACAELILAMNVHTQGTRSFACCTQRMK